MRFILTALLFVGGLFFTLYGIAFLVLPTSVAPGFGLDPAGPHGWATLRADMTAFFIVAGLCTLRGSWNRSGDILLVPAALFGIAFTGRLVGIFTDGTYDQFWQPMLIEASMVVLCLAAHHLLPHHKIGEITS